MVDPLSIAVLGGIAATEGIKFLYGQAAEILKRRRERRDAERAGTPPPAEPIPVGDPGVLEGELAPLEIDDAVVDRLEGQIKALRTDLADYADGVAGEADTAALEKALRLRDLLEASVGQRITFRGEDREPSGTDIRGRVDVGELAGQATAVEMDAAPPGAHVEGTATADVVTETGKIVGVSLGSSKRT